MIDIIGEELPFGNFTLRVGCELTYDSAVGATLLLNLRPRSDPIHPVLEERLSFGADLPVEQFADSHGNIIYRLPLKPGRTEVRHDAIVSIPSTPDNYGITSVAPIPPHNLPASVLRYTLPSRYCESDKLANFAWEKFGQIEHGLPRVLAISEWLHKNIEYRYASGRPDLSAWDFINRGYGVCRDFAHGMIALCRTFSLPARYVTGHLPDIGVPDPDGHMDFHAYAEVFLGGQWLTFDARFHVPRIGRVKVSSGLDAVDGAFSTIYGGADLTNFRVWAYQIERGTVSVGDPIDLSKRLDNTVEIRSELNPTLKEETSLAV